jgi:PleD family two-component response regulator
MPNEAASYPRPPLVLIVTDQEWVSLSFETLFSPRGYAVLRAYHASHVLRRVEEMPVDLLIIDRELRGMNGVDLCRQLRQQSLLSPSAPIVMIAPSPWSREERLEALRSGAWDVCSLPMDSEELFLRVDAWVRAKLMTDAARDQGLLDPDTGLYNAQGLLRRIAEVGANAMRHHRPLACVVVSAGGEAGGAGRDGMSPSWRTETVRSVASTLRALGRASDSVGRLNPSEFVIVAPETDTQGALALAERLRAALEALPTEASTPLEPRFGCYAVTDFSDESIAPTEMLVRAAEALRNAEMRGQHIQFFRQSADAN